MKSMKKAARRVVSTSTEAAPTTRKTARVRRSKHTEPVVDVKSAAANDVQPVVEVPVAAPAPTPEAPKAAKKAKKVAAPKAAPVRLSPEQVSANRKEGLRLFALAGRPSHADFRKLLGATGHSMTWIQRAKALGLSSAEEAAKQFQSLLAAKGAK